MIKAAIIGLGKMGLSHCAILNAHPEVDLESICDSSSLVLDVFKKFTGKRVYTDYKSMLNENHVDCVIIAAPTKHHYDMVGYALEKNLHVFCEKPFSLTVSEGEQLIRLVKEKKVVNQVGYHNRFVGTFREVKRLLEAGILGDVYHFVGEAYGPVVVRKKGGTWRSKRNEGGGCLFDYASHVINLIEYLLGVPVEVRGTSLKRIHSEDVEDAVFSTLALENGLSGLLSVNWSDETYRKMSTSITIYGKKGKIASDAQELRIYLTDEQKKQGLKKGWNTKYITGLAPNVDFYLRGEEYSAQISYFVDQIRHRKLDNVNSFESALRTDKVIEMLLKDARAS